MGRRCGGQDLLSNKVLNAGGGGEVEKRSPDPTNELFREFSRKKSDREEKTGIFSPQHCCFPPLFHLHGGSRKAYKLPKLATLPC